jgi:hypothetical protein
MAQIFHGKNSDGEWFLGAFLCFVDGDGWIMAPRWEHDFINCASQMRDGMAGRSRSPH